MTELQKKIQKTSRFTANTFKFITIFPLGGILVTLVALGGLLTGNDAIVQQLILEAPRAATLQIVLFLLCTIAVLGLAFYCLLQAQAIFRDISQEYTPFRPVHVQRMRRIALVSIVCIFGQALTEAWSLQLRGGSFTVDLNLAYFLIPLVVCSFSFILDYACQLQAEADTTL
ncbi:MAG: hypothetical protein IKK61_08905 [Clostridia bacterium]|nr:hypothetical protein [Clostridia bacterium]